MIEGYNRAKTEQIKRELNKWLGSQNPSHLLTARLPFPAYTTDFNKAERHLHKITKRLEKCLLGCHWNRSPAHFRGFAERGDFRIWHFHLLLLASKYTTEQLQGAVAETCDYLKLTNGITLDLRPIEYTPDWLYDYCMKELRADGNGRFDSDRLIVSEDLFNLPVKPALVG
jgi:hypothetical protein